VSNKFREKTKPTELKKEPENVELKNSAPGNQPPKSRKKGVLAKGLSAVFSGTFLTNQKALKHTPFLLFLALIAILYIANGYYADGKIRDVNKTANQLKELRSEYISTKSDLMFISKQSEVAKSVEEMGLKEPVVPPMKIESDTTKVIAGNGE
jgi:hypothetical protein